MTTYLDFAASAPVRPAALEAFVDASALAGNAASTHASGRAVRRVVEESRESVAATFGVAPTSVFLCSGGTEANNLGVKGLYWQRRAAGSQRDVIVISEIEHPAVLEAARWLVEHDGAELVMIPTLPSGVIDAGWLDTFVAQNADSIALVAVMWANNETGVVQPIDAVLATLDSCQIPLHCDGAQAVASREVPAAWSRHPMTIAVSGHKFGAPVGVGALVASHAIVKPVAHGGGQEFGVRSGSVPAALAAALSVALREAHAQREQGEVVAMCRKLLIDGLAELDTAAVINGAHAGDVLSAIVSVTFPGCPADAMLMLLDAHGISCSAGSACAAGVPRPSRVLLAMGLGEDAASQTLRFSFGWSSTVSDVDALLTALPQAIDGASKVTGKQRSLV